MARQIMQINVSQDASGGAITISCNWSSDEYPVKKTRHYLRQPGGYTVDARLFTELDFAVYEQVMKLMDQGQLF
jgi:hypothetical protein